MYGPDEGRAKEDAKAERAGKGDIISIAVHPGKSGSVKRQRIWMKADRTNDRAGRYKPRSASIAHGHDPEKRAVDWCEFSLHGSASATVYPFSPSLAQRTFAPPPRTRLRNQWPLPRRSYGARYTADVRTSSLSQPRLAPRISFGRRPVPTQKQGGSVGNT